MAVWTESQVCIMCDRCSYSDESSTHFRQEFISLKRSEGWKHGKVTLCPKCAKQTKKDTKGE